MEGMEGMERKVGQMKGKEAYINTGNKRKERKKRAQDCE
jgi:hypothetical protein